MHQKKMSRNASLKCLVESEQKKPQPSQYAQLNEGDQPLDIHPIMHNYDFEKELLLKFQIQQAVASLKQESLIPAMITIHPQEQKEMVKLEKVGVDLVCVIDKSGSMQGDKMIAVKKTLVRLLDFLSETDRLCLIQFDIKAIRLCPFLKITAENKPVLQEIINKLSSCGETSIYQGMKIAVDELEKRKFLNNVAAVFLLSDGQDPYGKQKVSELLSRQTDQVYTIHSFGYGQDHDPDLMTSICQLKKGSFYFIDNVDILDEYFISALGALQTVIAEQITIELETLPLQNPFKVEIAETHGKYWQEIEPKSKYSISIFHLAQGLKKNFVFTLRIPQSDLEFEDVNRQQTCLKATVSLTNTASNEVFKKEAFLRLSFYQSNEPIPAVEIDEEVIAEVFRVSAVKIIDDAMRACIENKNEEGEKQIQRLISEIGSSHPRVQKLTEQTLFQLEQSLKACSRKSFQTYGYSQMHSIRMISQNQFGLNSQFDSEGKQTVEYRLSHANKAQIQMSTLVKQTKSDSQRQNDNGNIQHEKEQQKDEDSV